MFSQTLLTFVLASLAVVKAVDIWAYSNTLGCSGSAVGCTNLPVHSCCSSVPAGFGFSVAYNNLPGPVSDGQAWTSTNCVSGPVFTDQIGTGNKCYVGGGKKINSVAWTNAASKRTVGAIGEVVTPDKFKYTVDGVEKIVDIPSDEGAIETMLSMYKAGNFSGLQTYTAAN